MLRGPDDVARDMAMVRARRRADTPFECALDGYSTARDGDLVRSYQRAGVTWWLEPLHRERGTVDELMARILDGPALP